MTTHKQYLQKEIERVRETCKSLTDPERKRICKDYLKRLKSAKNIKIEDRLQSVELPNDVRQSVDNYYQDDW